MCGAVSGRKTPLQVTDGLGKHRNKSGAYYLSGAWPRAALTCSCPIPAPSFAASPLCTIQNTYTQYTSKLLQVMEYIP